MLTSVASLMVALDALVVSTALSTIGRHFGASIQALQWTVNAYVLSLAVLLMTGATLGDRFGRRRLFAAGLGLFAAASAACALAPSVGWLIAARAVQGAGAALTLPLALALLSAAFPPDRRGWALGVYGGVTGIGVLLGPLLGGAVVQAGSWPWIFWLNVPVGLITCALVLRRTGESFGPPTAVDLGGLVLVTGAALAAVWGLMRGNTVGWGGVEVPTALAAGVLLAVAFVAWELAAAHPMLPMRLFAARAFSAGNTAIFCLWASVLGSVFFMAQFLQVGLGYGPLGAGLRLMAPGAAALLVAPLAGAGIDRIGERPFVVGGLLLHAAGTGWIALIAQPHLGYGQLIAPQLIASAGAAIATPATQNSVVGSVPPRQIATASGTFTMIRQLGGVFGIAIAVAVFAGAGSYASPRAFTDGFAPAIGVCAALCGLGAVAGLAVPARRSRRATAEEVAGSTRPIRRD